MPDVQSFHKHLRGKGKKDHVALDMCARALRFEEHLRILGRTLEAASEEDLAEFSGRDPRGGKNDLRALALYYAYAGNRGLAQAASEMRERRIAETRAAFEVGDFMGVDPDHTAALTALGIVDVNQMIDAGKTPMARQLLSAKTQIPLDRIEEYVKLADISRIGAVKAKRARLYIDAGIDTIDKVAALSHEDFRRAVAEFVERSGFDGIPTLPKEAQNAVKAARSIERLVIW